jgi:elongation factor 3
METYFTNVDSLKNKKTKSDEKITILNSIDLNNTNDEYKLKLVSYLLTTSGDRDVQIKTKSNELVNKIIDTINPYLITNLTLELLDGLTSDKNIAVKLNTIGYINKLSYLTTFRESISLLIEPLSFMLSEFDKKLVEESIRLYEKILVSIDNKDILPLVPSLIDGLSNPQNLAKTIDSITSTTFVQVVDSLTLNAIIPLLMRTFRNSTYAVKRQSIIIIENMTKLVEDERSALDFVNKLLPFMEEAKEEISDPEVRSVADRVCKHLITIKTKGEELQLQFNTHLDKIKSFINFDNTQLDILKTMFNLNKIDKINLQKYLNCDDVQADNIIKEINTNNKENTEDNINAKELCNITFTLGYGSKVLLHQTQLKLYKGYKYGLIGPNNSGKTTLMRSMATQQLESFPPELKSVFVETDILGELSHLSLIDYIMQDKKLQQLNLEKDYIITKLKEMNFTDDMIRGGVSALSGGWRMKLALTRALMQDADILLMDEPTAHLDVINVKWLLEYIISLKDVTCIIVSQNSKLLNNCCTHIMQIKNLKLHTTYGNLEEFLKKNPEAMSYFELKTDKYKFKFPQPRYLDGVKSKGKALMKMENVTFTYPGNTSPTIKNASVQVSMSSRIGCLGPNGAGKSTSIKILTGQLEPQVGSVWTYPGVKFGYIAQHAFAHIENHLEKTPNEYIRWRYEGGEDKEDLKKASMQMTKEDIAKLDTEITIEIDDKRVKKEIKRLTYGRRIGRIEKEYEVELVNTSNDLNQWIGCKELIKRGYEKLLKIIDSKCDAAENSYQMALTQQNVEDHLEKVGMNRETATHVKIKHLSNGDKVKVVIGASLWMLPHILILDEPTNNIDRDGLAALSEAIKEFEGGIIIITHDEQFCHSVCKEIWVIENCILNIKGDPDWMKNVTGEKIEMKLEEEMIDANGNTVKIKQPKKELTRREKMAREKKKKLRRELGEEVSDSDDEY